MTDQEERNRKARIRSAQAVQQRLGRAVDRMAVAVTQDAIEVDKFGHEVAIANYKDAEEDVVNALSLIRDCRRSIEGRSE